MALTDDDLQNLAQEREIGARFVYHIDPVSGNDNNPGKSWGASMPLATFNQAITLAAANFANKPVAFWFNGPINLGTGFINYQTTNLGPVKTRGFGRFAAITSARPNDATIRTGTACEYEDFEIISAAGADTYNYLIGDAGSSIQDVVIRHLRMKGTTDGTYFTGATSQYTVIESIIDSQWDTFYAQNGSVGRFIRCFHNSLGPHQISGISQHIQGAGQCNGSTVYIIGGTITFRATNSDTARVAYGIHAFNNGLIELHGDSSIMCEVPNGTVVDLKTDSASEIKVSSNSSFNLARSLAGSTGTLTQYLAYGDTRQWLGTAPNALTANKNVPAAFEENGAGINATPNTVAGTVPDGTLPVFSGQALNAAINYSFSALLTLSNTNLTNWTEVLFTVKQNTTDTDANAKLTIKVSNPASGGDGITVLNGGAPVSAADGSITVSATATTFNATVATIDRGMAVAPGKYTWEMAVWAGGVKQAWLGNGPFIVAQTAIAAL